MDQVLKDKNGFTIGKIKQRSDGVQELKDKQGFKLGTYDPKQDVTKDKRGIRIGKGNLLATLLE